MSTANHSIRAVAKMTRLTQHVIRSWERRYRAVSPVRTPSKRRLYSDEEVERLILLRRLTQAGQSIGFVAQLPTDRLRELAESAGPEAVSSSGAGPSSEASPAEGESAADLVDRCMKAVKALDAGALEDTLRRAELALGAQGMLQRVVAPLAQSLGGAWRDGSITAAHEHFSSALLRTWLGRAARAYAIGALDPVLVVATPVGQMHELGAMLIAAAAANLGWRVIYLGAGLPAAEIAGAARQHAARAVALSLVYPEDDARVADELRALREALPASVKIIIGGRAMASYREAGLAIGALLTEEVSHLGEVLDEVRRPNSASRRS